MLHVNTAFDIEFPEPSYAVAATFPDAPAEMFNEEGFTVILAAEPVAGEPTCIRAVSTAGSKEDSVTI
jgi:hypothetical protein